MKKLLLLSIAACASIALAGCGVTSSPPPPPPVATHLAISGASLMSTAGSSFSFTVSALDASGAVVTSYSGTVQITTSDPQAQPPSDAALVNGTLTLQVIFKTAGPQSISASDVTKVLASGSGPVNVTPGPAAKLSVSLPSSAVTVGLSNNGTVTAYDAYANTATNFADALALSSNDPQAVFQPSSLTLGNGVGSFSVTFKTVSNQTTITATDQTNASLTATSASINVVSNAATHFSVTPNLSSVNVRQTVNLTVQALDAANHVSTGYSGTVHVSSSDSAALLPQLSTLANGVGTFSATPETGGAGTQSITTTITATDTAIRSITGSASISVSNVPLAISSSAPPNGKVGTVYGEVRTIYLRCAFFLGRLVCRPCTPGPGGTCGSLPLCGIRGPYPCIEITHPFVGFKFAGTGGVPPYNTWTVAGLPSGLTVNPSNGEILGTPTSPGAYPLTVTMTDSGLPTATLNPPASFTLTINPPDVPVVNTTPPPPPGVLGQLYSYTFTAKGYGPLTFNESGALPGGLTFSSGLLSGTPTQTGSFPITVTATDQFKQTSNPPQAFTIVVTAHGFVATGSMATARRFHTATLLKNGKVLVTGGSDCCSTVFSTAELLDPSTGTFTKSISSMTVPRAGHTATLLNDGTVLLIGGSSVVDGAALPSAEIYDPVHDTFTATGGSMAAARVFHTATLLSDGKVLVAGGDSLFFNGTGQSLASAEIYDPSTGKFTPTMGNMNSMRESHTATLLNDGTGRVLIAGGSIGTVGYSTTVTVLNTAELFDPSKLAFTAAGLMTTPRAFHSASLLSGSNAKVLIVGGLNSSTGLASAELFDPKTGSFMATGGVMEAPRWLQDATLLTDGTVLLTGGTGATRAVSTAELYDPTQGTFLTTGSMIAERVWHTSTLLNDGTVLVTGGADVNSAPLNTAEVYH